MDMSYRIYHIPKRNGTKRQIEEPNPDLKDMQRIILKALYSAYKPSQYATGFRHGYGVFLNAKPHEGAVKVISIDIEDFFPSIRWGMIKGYLDEPLKSLVKEYCLYDERLPQGAPTSPALSNIMCYKMDNIIGEMAKEQGIVYTRYADDLTFSSTTDPTIARLIPRIKEIIKRFGFKVNTRKTKVFGRHCKMMVTGAVVNDKVNVPRVTRRKFRARLHNALMGLRNRTIRPDEINMLELRGHASWIYSLNPQQGQRFFAKIGEIEAEIGKI